MSAPPSHKPSASLPASSTARYGCYLGLVSALFMLGYGLIMLGSASADPMPFKIAFLVGGAIQALVSVLALQRNRAAWAFALSLNGTLVAVFLFGATKIRDGFDVSIYVGLVPAVAFSTITILLALGADEY